MFLVFFTVCFITAYLMIKWHVRRASEFPKALPFPLWMHLLFAAAALVLALVALAVTELIMRWLE